eukprot:3168471-Heterocapsa_arctica.AAC.1
MAIFKRINLFRLMDTRGGRSTQIQAHEIPILRGVFDGFDAQALTGEIVGNYMGLRLCGLLTETTNTEI